MKDLQHGNSKSPRTRSGAITVHSDARGGARGFLGAVLVGAGAGSVSGSTGCGCSPSPPATTAISPTARTRRVGCSSSSSPSSAPRRCRRDRCGGPAIIATITATAIRTRTSTRRSGTVSGGPTSAGSSRTAMTRPPRPSSRTSSSSPNCAGSTAGTRYPGVLLGGAPSGLRRLARLCLGLPRQHRAHLARDLRHQQPDPRLRPDPLSHHRHQPQLDLARAADPRARAGTTTTTTTRPRHGRASSGGRSTSAISSSRRCRSRTSSGASANRPNGCSSATESTARTWRKPKPLRRSDPLAEPGRGRKGVRKMAGLAGLEPATFRLGVRRSIHLSYSPAGEQMLVAVRKPCQSARNARAVDPERTGQTEEESHPSASTLGTQIGRPARAGWRASPSMSSPAGEPRRSTAPTKPGARITDCPTTSSLSNEIDSEIASLEPSAETIFQRLGSRSAC